MRGAFGADSTNLHAVHLRWRFSLSSRKINVQGWTLAPFNKGKVSVCNYACTSIGNLRQKIIHRSDIVLQQAIKAATLGGYGKVFCSTTRRRQLIELFDHRVIGLYLIRSPIWGKQLSCRNPKRGFLLQ